MRLVMRRRGRILREPKQSAWIRVKQEQEVVALCLLSIFRSGTRTGHLEESENHYRRSGEPTAHHLVRAYGEAERRGGRRDEMSCKRGVNWNRRSFLHTRVHYGQLTLSPPRMCLVSEEQRPSPSDVIRGGLSSVWGYRHAWPARGP